MLTMEYKMDRKIKSGQEKVGQWDKSKDEANSWKA